MTQKKKLAVIGASYLQLPLVRKAQEMGLEVHCFAWEDGAVCKDVADYNPLFTSSIYFNNSSFPNLLLALVMKYGGNSSHSSFNT